MTGLRIGSLFSGYMGLDMAVESVTGATTAWVSDIDKGACKILAHRAPDVPNLGDITAIDWANVEPVDILTGGFPCQDLSHAGKRAGLKDGTRSGLWSHMARAIDELRPRLVVAENVRGLLSAPAPGDVEPCPWCVGDGPTVDLRALGVVLADLADIGYDAQWCGLRAADVGACHGRFRVFLIALPTESRRGGRKDEELRQRRRDIGRNKQADDASYPAGDGRDEGWPEPARLRGELGLLPTPTATDAHASGGGYNGQSNVTLTDATVRNGRFGDYAPAIARWEHVIGRPAPDPTEPTGKNGAHRLSPAFVEWMMGLPAGWVTDVPGLTRNEALKALGNGVVPQQAAAALTHMLATEAAA